MDEAHNGETFHAAIISWYESSERTFLWRKMADPYEILVAEILLQRTFAEKVEPVFAEILDRYPNPKSLAEADSEEIEKLLKPLGLQRKKAKALIEIGRQVRASGVPQSKEMLLELPYVGRYVANAVLCFGFGERRSIVDANVVRIFERVFDDDLDGDRDEAAWGKAKEMLPSDRVQEYNLGLLDLGATLCTPTNPECGMCPVNQYCKHYEQSEAT